MADLENVKIVDEEKQEPLLQGSAPEKSESGVGRRKISGSDKFTRVVLVLLLILNFVQWRYSMISRDVPTADKTEDALLKIEDQVRGLCLDRVALLKALKTVDANSLNGPGHDAQDAFDNFPSTTRTESETFTEAFKMMQKVLVHQNELLYKMATAQLDVSNPYSQDELHSMCDMMGF